MGEQHVTFGALREHCAARHKPIWWIFGVLCAVVGSAVTVTVLGAADVAVLKNQAAETKEWRAEVRAQLREIRVHLDGNKAAMTP